MYDEEKIDAYRTQLTWLGHGIAKLANSDTQIKRLIRNQNLDPLEQAIRDFIEKFL